ncbi:DUF262 domain-containing protein [Thiothrix lacustris]|uniref:DUF262 domain-containing protein n=1 Tax=Thiothrix lacustris TaxID=525917 RepID=A0ABY9MQI4_9GAMM|nr:DUF262 domain-containing protein [Thiothrix lacustris]WML90813.1 DUF262 domain-containing protein [Thiothrix lacustris]
MTTAVNNQTNESNEAEIEKQIISVRELLGDTTLSIPQYQRPYKWTAKHINHLFADIALHKNKSSYRLGTIVFHREYGKLNIVDGQQRTISLLLTLRALITLRRDKLEWKDLKRQLDELELKMINPSFESNISKNNIHSNYLEISRIVSRTDFTEELIDFLLNKCTFVTFTLSDISEAFQFFDSQNARGRDLEPHDLLKAYHLREFSEGDEKLKAKTVAHWESCETAELAELFAQYLYRIRSWAKGNSARYFGKDDTPLFKGVNIENIGHYPYVEHLRMTHHFVDNYNRQYERKIDGNTMVFPFHLDQIIINGRRFFEMITHYQKEITLIKKFQKDQKKELTGYAQEIMNLINNYDSRNRTGDQYVRSIFNCLLLYYIDKFGTEKISHAIEKCFIWAYSLRLKMYRIEMATIDNYVVNNNLFKIIKDSTRPEDFITFTIPSLKKADVKSSKTDDIEELFKGMRYYEQ